MKERNVTIRRWDLNYEHPFGRVSKYYRVSDIMEVDIMEFRVYKYPIKKNYTRTL